LEGDIDANGHAMRWVLVVGASLMVVVAACSNGPMSGTEYVESLNALVVDAGSDFEASLAAYEQVADPTLEDFIGFVEQQLVFEYEVRDRFDTFDPPSTVDEVNQVMIDTLARIITAAEGLVEVADTVGSLEELQQTPEFAEYQGVNTDADSMCQDVQAKLNDLSTRPVIDSPWLTDLQRTVRAFLDCDDTGTN
jgi:hypothetical protein